MAPCRRSQRAELSGGFELIKLSEAGDRAVKQKPCSKVSESTFLFCAKLTVCIGCVGFIPFDGKMFPFPSVSCIEILYHKL